MEERQMNNASTGFQWRRTNAPVASSRTDDLWFLDAKRGWAVNSNGQILHTVDGGDHWEVQLQTPGVYLRCVGFANAQRGWVGTLAAAQRLFQTSDGGSHWTPVTNLPAAAPSAICGLSVVSDQVVYGSGTNFPNRAPGVIKTTDGGATWTAIDMRPHATLLVDVYFQDALRGWVVGGKAETPNPTRDDVRPVVLRTEDGGQTWQDRVAGIAAQLPKGEWGWKIQWLSSAVGFVALENFNAGAILKTTDGGLTWARKPVNDAQENANLEGIGFVDDRHGWVGGWGDRNFQGGFTSETRDGGETWQNANEVGKRLNRFRWIRQPELVGYASGDTVYKFSSAPVPHAVAMLSAPRGPDPELVRRARPLEIPFSTPAGTRYARIDVWDRFGEHVATPLEARAPEPGPHAVSWAVETPSGERLPGGFYIHRVQMDDAVESHTVLIGG
jgi:photosystem II stability/assembly factor-like uncharacterized protein